MFSLFHIFQILAISFISFWVVFNGYVQCDIYSSIAGMENLLKMDNELRQMVDTYIKNERKRLDLINTIAKAYTRIKTPSQADKFLSNPINIFHLIKRFAVRKDLDSLLNMINSSPNEVLKRVAANNSGIRVNFPDETDFKGAAFGLSRLQETYNLTVSSIVNGAFTKKSRPRRRLSGEDCYDVALQLIADQKYSQAILWLLEVLRLEKNKGNEITSTVERGMIFKYLSFSYYRVGSNELALKYANEILKIEPNDRVTQTNKIYYESAIETAKVETKKELSPQMENIYDINKAYNLLCRNKRKQKRWETAKLKCYYSTNELPYLLLQPTKVEDLNLKPWVALFHDVMSDNEMKEIRTIASPRLFRSGVGGVDDMNSSISESRISKVAWLSEIEFSIIERVKKRLEAITDLFIVHKSEPLQISNYGIGGFYENHVDFADPLPDTQFHRALGNRLATALFYLNEVTAGGRTVFPFLNVTVEPKKGAALFWYNLYPSGQGNQLTMHAGCPVLAGNKWVSNLWIRQYPQAFKAPCGLNQYDLFFS